MTRQRSLASTTRNLILVSLALASVAPACHDDAPREEAIAPVGQDSLALACEADLSCPGGGSCDPVTLRCVDCQSDADCPGGVCDAAAHVCVQCVSDGDCARGVCHPTRNVCVACWQDAQCQTGLCHPELLACVECLGDADCTDAAGRGGSCNLATFACSGECTRDAQCDDQDTCTVDRCVDGGCDYVAVASQCCEDLERPCPFGSTATDTNGDGCTDACLCTSGDLVRPNGSCPCTEATPVCPLGTKLADEDRDGCFESCVCASGAVVGPDGSCPCPSVIACEGGLAASDLDGDGCPETCTKPCQTSCDCEAQGLVAATPCALACAQCGAFVACEEGVCQGRCGVVPDAACACPTPPSCGPLESAVDTDGDQCNDTCACLVAASPGAAPRDPSTGCGCPFEIGCTLGSHPADTDQDGCNDTCVCDDPTRVPAADGSCCAAFACPIGTLPVDKDGDGCDDACVCASGAPARDAAPFCDCVAPSACPPDAKPVDDDGDQCADRCACEDGSAPGPNGCGTCFTTCGDAPLPPYALFVDVDKDGCYDLVDACPVGTQSAATAPDGCPDTCVTCPDTKACPAGATGVDGDGDNCPESCVCADGRAPTDAGCACSNEPTCVAPAAPVDRDGDGCADDCVVACSSACDCSGDVAATAELAITCGAACATCTVSGACVEGFCAWSCGATPSAPCPVSVVDASVCGCDDKSYLSACEAALAGVAVKRNGTCEASGCLADADCAPGQACELPTGVCVVNAAAGEPGAVPVAVRGECVALPTACLGTDAPVCGCDGKTYASDCERRKAGVALSASGPCP